MQSHLKQNNKSGFGDGSVVKTLLVLTQALVSVQDPYCCSPPSEIPIPGNPMTLLSYTGTVTNVRGLEGLSLVKSS